MDHGTRNKWHHMSNVLLVCLASHSTTTAQVLSNRCLYPVHRVYPSLSTTTVQVMTFFAACQYLVRKNWLYYRLAAWDLRGLGQGMRSYKAGLGGLLLFGCVLYVSVLYTNPYHLSHHPHHRFQGTRRPKELPSWHQSLVLI